MLNVLSRTTEESNILLFYWQNNKLRDGVNIRFFEVYGNMMPVSNRTTRTRAPGFRRARSAEKMVLKSAVGLQDF